MNYLKKKSSLVSVLCLLLVLLLLIGFVIVMELQKHDAQPAEEMQATEKSTEYMPAAPVGPLEESELIELETPYCSLYFPRLWEDYLCINPVEGDSYCMEFGYRIDGDAVYRLFDVSFGSGSGTRLGTVTANDGSSVDVYMLPYTPDEALSGEKRETFLAMQEDVNQLIAKLMVTNTTQMEEAENILIQTPFCQLTYPGQWEEYLQVEYVNGKNYVVNLYAAFDGMEQIHLFSVKFSTETEDALMVIKDGDGNEVGVCIDMKEVPENGMTDEQMDTVYAMQEAVNELLDALARNGN